MLMLPRVLKVSFSLILEELEASGPKELVLGREFAQDRQLQLVGCLVLQV